MSYYQNFYDRAVVRETDYLDVFTRLLAGENIQIVEVLGASTASFNLASRIITLPIFNNGSIVNNNKDVAILFRGHEVAHALWSPLSLIHDTINSNHQNFSPSLRSCVNLVEDIRIEKLIKRRYVGLNPIFRRGYTCLYQNGFFGADEDNAFRSFNRFNLRSKLGRELFDQTGIKFTAKEEAIYAYIASANSVDDVIPRAKYLASLLDELQDEIDQHPEQFVARKLIIVLEDENEDYKEGDLDSFNPDDFDEVEFIDKRTKPSPPKESNEDNESNNVSVSIASDEQSEDNSDESQDDADAGSQANFSNESQDDPEDEEYDEPSDDDVAEAKSDLPNPEDAVKDFDDGKTSNNTNYDYKDVTETLCKQDKINDTSFKPTIVPNDWYKTVPNLKSKDESKDALVQNSVNKLLKKGLTRFL